MASLLKEAQCLSATHARNGFTEIDRHSEPKPATHRHAKPRHRAAAPR
jgi:hypothetical protein